MGAFPLGLPVRLVLNAGGCAEIFFKFCFDIFFCWFVLILSGPSVDPGISYLSSYGPVVDLLVISSRISFFVSTGKGNLLRHVMQ